MTNDYIPFSEWVEKHPKLKELTKDYDVEGISISGGNYNENRQSSFFYDGWLFELKYKDRLVEIIASGEIRIFKNGELVYDVKERNEGFGFSVETDEDFAKVNEENGFEWGMNNWIEYTFRHEGDKDSDFIMGDVDYEVDSGICRVLLWLKDEEWWQNG